QSRGNRGLLWTTTKGLGQWGLPELEICDAPADLSERLCYLINGVAHWLLSELATQAHAAGSGALKVLTLEREPVLRLEHITEGMQLDVSLFAEDAVRSTPFRLEFRPG